MHCIFYLFRYLYLNYTPDTHIHYTYNKIYISDCLRFGIAGFNFFNPYHWKGSYMVLILDGSSEYFMHALRKTGIFGNLSTNRDLFLGVHQCLS